jgi:ubiquitin carboxyl-terminal hydrolase 10
MVTLPSNGAGPSRPTSTASFSSSSSISTIQRQTAYHDDDSFPIITLSISSPSPSPTSQFWHLDKPDDNTAGVSFSPSSSTTTTSLTGKKIATSPYAQQRAAHASLRSHTQVASVRSKTVILLENTLKLNSLGVSDNIPESAIAPAVTLSTHCRPDAKVIFDQTHFTNGKNGASTRYRSSTSDSKEALSRIRTEEEDSLHRSTASFPSQDSEMPSAISSQILASPASTSSYLAANTTATTSFTQPDGDAQSVTSTTSSVPASSKKPAWSTPRSWAEMASSRNNNGSAPSLGTPFTEHLDSRSSMQDGGKETAQMQIGRGAAGGSRGPLGLEEIVQHAETRFSAPLTYPRGMINKGNLCFANAVGLETL